MKKHELRRLVEVWQERLGLGHFKIHLDVRAFEPVTDAAQCACSPDYDEARIVVQPWVLKGKPPEESDLFGSSEDPVALVIHELLHISVRPLRRAKRLIEDTNSLHRDVQRIFDEAWDQREEECVDRLAVALARAWPK